MKSARTLLLAAAILLFAMMVPQIAGAATINLSQGGWDQGGPLNITFTSDDTDLSGGIETSELVSFTAIFGLSGGGTATWSLPDLGTDGFFWASSSDYFIKAANANYSLYDISVPGGAIALVSDSIGSVLGISGDPLETTPSSVPEPGTAALFVLGIAVMRRHRLT